MTGDAGGQGEDPKRFVAFGKGDFVGRKATLLRKQQGIRWKLAYLEVDAPDLDVLGSEAIHYGDRIVGVVTSGAYGHAVGKNLAFAYVEPPLTEPGTKLAITMLGGRYGCTVLEGPVYDPANERLRA
ncbi:MAG: glycine cleavage T C-terminal barrel domain-containing protein [Hyphomicrobiaceae bacterium]